MCNLAGLEHRLRAQELDVINRRWVLRAGQQRLEHLGLSPPRTMGFFVFVFVAGSGHLRSAD